jgi:hypothetical protein
MPDQATIPTRPGTLAEVVRRVRDDREAIRFCLAGFLDEFYADRAPAGRRARLETDPGLLEDERHDALIGAIGEHLCDRWALGDPPAWTNDPTRFLARPWFMGPERMKPFLLAESPSAFRRRFIFTEAEPLRRAVMPKDGRWWAYETLRTGLVPEPGDIEVSQGRAVYSHDGE